MKILLTTLFMLAGANLLRAQTSSDNNKPDTNFHLYILAGQSNMAGRGLITGDYVSEGNPAVFVLNKNNEWVVARHPLHFDKSIAGVGPGLAFGLQMAKAYPGKKIGLIPCAVGGTSIDSWQPGGYDEATKTHPYDDAELRIKVALRSGVIKGMLWHQGESDSSPKASKEYLAKLQALIERIRRLTGNSKLPVVAGELGRYKEQFQTINIQLQKLPALVPFTAVASSEDLKDKGDSTHFDSPGAEILGQRFAAKMISMKKGL